jgi:hypothetical protein
MTQHGRSRLSTRRRQGQCPRAQGRASGGIPTATPVGACVIPRLALCHVCHTLTRLPDPPAKAPLVQARIAWREGDREVEHVFRDDDGHAKMVAQYDPALEDWVTRHSHDNIPIPDTEKFGLWYTDQQTWNSADVVATLKKEYGDVMASMYKERDELKDDALECFEKHQRPTTSCPDVFTEAKVIGSHESNKHMPPDKRMYMCHACPYVHGYVVPKVRHEKGYDDPVNIRGPQR